MVEVQFPRVQGRAVNEGKGNPVEGIPQHGQSHMSQMDADLVSATRLETALDLGDDFSLAVGKGETPFADFFAMSDRKARIRG
jgi:hypothetical protein